jgi:hypothetical protein
LGLADVEKDRQARRDFANNAPFIYNAALDGDVQFFRDIGLAFKASARARRTMAPVELDFSILAYWFAGQLWLMTDEIGLEALLVYVKAANLRLRSPMLDAYIKARTRLKLRGYRAFSKSAPILAYRPKTKRYQYASGWTNLDPV